MIPVSSVDHNYRLCGDSEIVLRPIDHPLFRDVSASVTRLMRALGEITRDDDWSEFLSVLRRYRFDLAAAPLPFSAPSVAPRWSAERLLQYIEVVRFTYPRFVIATREVVKSLLELSLRDENPLLDRVTELAWPRRSEATTSILLAASRLVEPTRLALSSRLETRDIPVMTANALRGTRSWEHLLVVGSPRWFPDYVFSAPRSPSIDVISYEWIQSTWEPTPVFLAPSVGRPTRAPKAGADLDDARPDNIGPENDWVAGVDVGRGLATSIERLSDDGGELVPARLYLLDASYATFLEATERRTAMIIDLEADERARVRQVADGEIEPGMFVVLRTDNAGDYVVPVADRLLDPNAVAYRAALALWKERLRERVRGGDAFETCLELLDLGSTRADEGNLRNWMSERGIAPQRREDFAAIMRLVGFDTDVDRLWVIARAIRNAHHRAGTIIRRQLVERVRLADIGELERHGRLDFELPEAEGGRLTAFRVEARSNETVFLPHARLERAFALDELEEQGMGPWRR